MKESLSESSPLSNLPKTLKPEDRLILEVLVVDEDTAEAQTFLIEHGITITEQDDPFKDMQRLV